MEKRISLHSPNGQFGALTILVGRFGLCVGFMPSLFGIDICWGTNMLSTSYLTEDQEAFLLALLAIVLGAIVIGELVYLTR